jgi:hypothetical protein
MADVSIKIEGLDKLVSRLGRVGGLSGVRAAIKGAAIHVLNRMKEYPVARHAPQPFVSDRQRIGFFKRLRAGDIEVPYRRAQSPGSQSMKHRWAMRTEDNGLTAVVGNNASYARLVQDEEKQTKYHKTTGWGTVQGVMKEERDLVTGMIIGAAHKALVE